MVDPSRVDGCRAELPRTEHALARPVPSGRPSGPPGTRRRPGERPGSTGVPLPSAGDARPLHIPIVMPCCFVTVRGRVLPIDLRNPVSSTPYRFDHHLDLFVLPCSAPHIAAGAALAPRDCDLIVASQCAGQSAVRPHCGWQCVEWARCTLQRRTLPM